MREFSIKASSKLYGPTTYTLYFKVYHTRTEMKLAYRKQYPGDLSHNENVCGLCHFNKCSSTIYLNGRDLKLDVLSHELLHAVIYYFRTKSTIKDFHLRNQASTKEELFCHIYGDTLDKVISETLRPNSRSIMAGRALLALNLQLPAIGYISG